MVQFVDRVTLHLRAGHGGNGCVSVHREKFKPLGGPDGGNGGDAGDIVVVADAQETSLLGYQRAPHRSSGNGGPGMGDHRSGYAGEETVLTVPVGTVVRDASGAELADLDHAGMRLVVAEGGRGGLGNAALATTKRKAPGFALLGTPGWEGDVVLELKTVADVALVGYPSAGKSSLIAALSAARPKIADYPFTTLHPNLGVVDAGGVRYTVADVPGLIEGASEGKGLGLEFLRHVERCSALLHVLDCATLEPQRDPLTDLDRVLAELGRYPVPEGQLPLLERPALVALNKVDVPEARELADLVRPELEERGWRVFEISAVSHAGLRELSFALAALVEDDRAARAAEPEPERIVLRPRAVDAKDFEIRVEGGTEPLFRVVGAKPERWVLQTDFTNDEAVGYLADRLAKLGVEEALFEAGATPGADVAIGAVEFSWEPTLASAAELISSPRGTDDRIGDRTRSTRSERRERYLERMDAKADAREELRRERDAGFWTEQYETDNADDRRGRRDELREAAEAGRSTSGPDSDGDDRADAARAGEDDA